MNKQITFNRFGFALLLLFASFRAQGQQVIISANWKMQMASKVAQAPNVVSAARFSSNKWFNATIPETALTTLVNNHVYPEPLYGENNRPQSIPDSLSRISYWYRTTFDVPASFNGKNVWLNFDGINYAANVWVNGKNLGEIKGAFTRGIFDITKYASPGKKAVLAVLVSPQPHPGIPHEHTIIKGTGGNGGISAIDGPTFLCSIGWDWIPGIRDRNTGIWRKVFLSSTGPLKLKDPLVTSDVSVPDLKSADLNVQTTIENISDKTQIGILKGIIGNVVFQQPVKIAPNSSQLFTFTPNTFRQLHIINPKLWWPNGYGPQNLHNLQLSLVLNGQTSDQSTTSFGIRKIDYKVAQSENLTISVNGVPVLCKGGNWGMDEAMKRIPRKRLDAQIRMHKIANYTMIRNWVGQSTNDDFYDLCDKYGLMLWDEFFQPNPSDGPNPADINLYLANVREKIVRYRNHPSIAVWCARNEGYPPANIDSALRKMMAELETHRLYQPSSTAGRGVNSGGPYFWRKPSDYYTYKEAFKTEIGSVSIPTLQSIHGMMPQKDWEVMNDDWAEHDLTSGAQSGIDFRKMIDTRYGKVINLADFTRKSQLANYEAFRAMYEGRNAKLFAPVTGVLTWMSNPAQPSFVWQLYHYDLEPNASLFAARKGCEPVHIQLNEKNGALQVINNLSIPLVNAQAELKIFDNKSALIFSHEFKVSASPSAFTTLDSVKLPSPLPGIYFVQLELKNNEGKLISQNFYWKSNAADVDNLSGLEKLPSAKLNANVQQVNKDGKCLLTVTLLNPGKTIALLAHLQLHRKNSKERVLPVFYSDNYISLVPGESRIITVEADLADLRGEQPMLLMDGWNVDVNPSSSIALNKESQVNSWPETGLPISYGTAKSSFKINCGGNGIGAFAEDNYFEARSSTLDLGAVEVPLGSSVPAQIYSSAREGYMMKYIFPMKQLPTGKTYTINFYWADAKSDAPGKRVFDVAVNGNKLITGFDIFAQAGGRSKAIVKQLTGIVPDQDGNIVIQFNRKSGDQPMINALEIY
ncbi:MAG: glycosyl hydrolase 2 galactose-binding domain-containing protein [Janthinobacterium lividum]